MTILSDRDVFATIFYTLPPVLKFATEEQLPALFANFPIDLS